MRYKSFAVLVLLCTSVVNAQSDRVLRKRITVDAPASDVWNAWTTVDGVKQFFPKDARIELKPGGAYEMYFSMTAPAGQRGCVAHEESQFQKEPSCRPFVGDE